MDLTREQIENLRKRLISHGDATVQERHALCDMALRARAEGEPVAQVAVMGGHTPEWWHAHPAPSGMRLVPEEASWMLFTPEQEKFIALVMDKTRACGHRLSNVEILRELAAPEGK